MSYILIGPSQKKIKTVETPPQIEDSIEKMGAYPFGPGI
jgi:hypothetical protein